jgi:hypothetical protein
MTSLREYDKELRDAQIELEKVIKTSVDTSVRDIIHILHDVLSDTFMWREEEYTVVKKPITKRIGFKKIVSVESNTVYTKNNVYIVNMHKEEKREHGTEIFSIEFALIDNMTGRHNNEIYKFAIKDNEFISMKNNRTMPSFATMEFDLLVNDAEMIVKFRNFIMDHYMEYYEEQKEIILARNSAASTFSIFFGHLLRSHDEQTYCD